MEGNHNSPLFHCKRFFSNVNSLLPFPGKIFSLFIIETWKYLQTDHALGLLSRSCKLHLLSLS